MTMFSDSLRAFLKPVVAFLDDPEVTEILINGPREVWIERKGKLRKTGAAFSEEGLMAAARNMAQYVGRQLTEERPRLDARLPDGSRIHVVLAPIARRGTTVSIRKFFAEKLLPEHLVGFGSMSKGMSRFLDAVVSMRLNLVIAGGTGSGKTSLLNALAAFIGSDERILTIEDSAELQLLQPHLVTLESRPEDRQGKGAVDIGDLLHSALRLRPDRIIVGEVRGGEAFHLLQAMNTGHGGSMTTTHANTPRDTLRRLESLCLLSGVDLPLRAVRAQVASAVHVVVCCERLPDGSRKVTHIAEVLPLDERGEYRVQDIFVFTQTARGPEGEVIGEHAPTGVLPTIFSRLRGAGFEDLDAAFFDPRTQGLQVPEVFAADLAERTVWAKGARASTDPDARAPGAAPAMPPAPATSAHATPPAPAAPAQAAPPAQARHAPTPPARTAAPQNAAPAQAARAPEQAAQLAQSPQQHGAPDQPAQQHAAQLAAPAHPRPAAQPQAPQGVQAMAAQAQQAPAPSETVPSQPVREAPASAEEERATSSATSGAEPTTDPARPAPPAASPVVSPVVSPMASPVVTAATRAAASRTPPPPARPAPAPAAPQQPAPQSAAPAEEKPEPARRSNVQFSRRPQRPPPEPPPTVQVEPLESAASARDEEPSIQLDPEMAAEVERRMPYESTLITRNPLLEQRDEDETNPGARNPHRRQAGPK